MARNKQNLKQQLITRLENQRAYGQKKEKEQRGVENYNSGRAVRGIHSYASMRTYKSSVATFADWMKTAHAEVRSTNDITESHVREYIEHRAESAVISRCQKTSPQSIAVCLGVPTTEISIGSPTGAITDGVQKI